MASWNDLKKDKQKTDSHDEYADACAACFGSPSGRRLLQILHSRYTDQVLGQSVDVRALRELNAKRHLVRELEDKTRDGLALLTKAKEPKRERKAP